MRNVTKFGICLGSLALASLGYGSISFNIAAGTLRDENGVAINGGLVILAVDTGNDGFALPSSSSFFPASDDMEVARWNFSEGGGLDGEFLASKVIALYDEANWTEGDRLALFWYPNLTKVSTEPGASKFGVFADPIDESTGDPWAMPADDTHLYSLQFFAEGSILNQTSFANQYVAAATLDENADVGLTDAMTTPSKQSATVNRISWDISAGAQAYTVERREIDKDGNPLGWETVTSVAGNVSQVNAYADDDMLRPGATYQYRVIAENGLSALTSLSDSELFSERSVLASVAARSMMESSIPRRMYGQVDVVGPAPVKKVIIQASGPWLAGKIIGAPVQDPSMELYTHPNVNFSDRVTVRTDIDDWMTEANALEIDQVQSDFGPSVDTRRVNVLAENSLDASWLGDINSGDAYTFAVNSDDSSEGPVHIGIYNAEEEGTQFAPSDNRIVALATRGYLGTPIGHKMFGEFTIEGNVKKTVLIRGLGPNLANFPPLNDGNPLRAVVEDPSITLYYHPDPVNDISNRTEIAFNDDWQSQQASAVSISDLAKIAKAEQAMLEFDPRQVAFEDGSKDALLLVDLDPGVYTFLLNAPGTGIGLLGIYEIEAAL
jgi:hypothetical protein